MTPSKRSRLLELAERCEKAQEGSRELDQEIFAVLNPQAPFVEDPRSFWPNRLIYDEVRAGDLRSCLRYTESVDAALTLVPEGWWYMFHWQGHPTASCAKDTHLGRMCRATTPALAICAAALRALAAQERDDE